MLHVTRARLRDPDDPSRPYVVHVYNAATGELLFWGGPYDIRDRDAAVRLFRQRK